MPAPAVLSQHKTIRALDYGTDNGKFRDADALQSPREIVIYPVVVLGR